MNSPVSRSPTNKANPAPARRRPTDPADNASVSTTRPAVALSDTQKRYLRTQCHHLKPLIMLGNKGVSEGVLAELDSTLDHHELVKIKLSGGDRDARQTQIDALLASSGAELVQQIGHVASVFRRNAEQPRLALPR